MNGVAWRAPVRVARPRRVTPSKMRQDKAHLTSYSRKRSREGDQRTEWSETHDWRVLVDVSTGDGVRELGGPWPTV